MTSVARLAVAGSLACVLTTVALGVSRARAQSADSSSGAIQDQTLPPPPNTNESRILGSGATDNGSAGSPVAPPVPEAPATAAPAVAAPTQWVQGKQAQLTILDKIYGSASKVTATVGTPFSVRFLMVDVLACWMRPPNQPRDAAVYLQVTDSHAPSGSPPEFRGWVFEAEPALSGWTIRRRTSPSTGATDQGLSFSSRFSVSRIERPHLPTSSEVTAGC